MNKKFAMCCAIARKSAGFSQEAVAELCGVSVRSISDYETGRTSVPDDIAAKMVKIYDAMWLGYLYLSLNSAVGQMILPEVEIKELSSSLLNLQVHMKKAQDIQLDFAEIGSDNIIEAEEQPIYERCLKVTSSLIGSAISVIVAPKKKSALAATSTDLGLKKIL
ncbi:MAG: helix-turn-helix transcriptional regulator [Selenomonadaceae bacterium]